MVQVAAVSTSLENQTDDKKKCKKFKFYCHGVSQEERQYFCTIFHRFPTPSKMQILLILSFRCLWPFYHSHKLAVARTPQSLGNHHSRRFVAKRHWKEARATQAALLPTTIPIAAPTPSHHGILGLRCLNLKFTRPSTLHIRESRVDRCKKRRSELSAAFYAAAGLCVNHLTLALVLHFQAFERLRSTRSLASFFTRFFLRT